MTKKAIADVLAEAIVVFGPVATENQRDSIWSLMRQNPKRTMKKMCRAAYSALTKLNLLN